MRRVAATALIFTVLGSALSSTAQKQSQAQPSGKKLEALFTAAQAVRGLGLRASRVAWPQRG